MYHGIINVYKEAGYTSHDVVAKLRGILKQKKIGHTGTLDPDAVGVLPVCLGSGTRLCEFLTDKTKEYVVVMQLGVKTDTQDLSGTILETCEVQVTETQLEEACTAFLGEYAQIPPMYSAIKVNGKRLYELARAGREVEVKPRIVRIDQITIENVELPYVTLRVKCGKGTYIRTLCQDIGAKCGCLAAMKQLTRTKSGRFCIEDALTLSQIEQLQNQGKLAEQILAVDSVFDEYPAVKVKPQFRKLIDNGNPLLPAQCESEPVSEEGSKLRVYRDDGCFMGVYCVVNQVYKPVRMFPGGWQS